MRFEKTVIVLTMFAVASPAAGADVAAGIDLFQSPPGASFTDEFNSVAGGTPIPAGFFDPGSDPFDGSIGLDGDPFPHSGNGPCLAPADTIVERLADAPFPVCPAPPITVPIQIVALSLVSSAPITVTFNGGLNPELWDIKVCLSDLPQQQGIMDINHLCPDGGTFFSTLPVLPKFIFTRQSDNAVRTFDTAVQLQPPTVFTTFAGWVHQSTISQVTQVGPGSEVDGNCDGILEVLPVGTSNFVPGIFPSPCDCSTPPGGSQQQKELTTEQAQLAAHGVLPAQDPQDDDGNGIPDLCEGGGLPKPVVPKWTQLPHGFFAGDLLLGSQPLGPLGSRVWEIAAPGGPDNPLPAQPISALSGLANIGHGIIGTSGHGGGGAIHELTCDGVLVSSRPSTDPTVLAMPGASTAPPAAAVFGFIPGNVYTTADTGTGVSDSLFDIGPDGAGPDINLGPLTDAIGVPILGIDGLAFDKSTGLLYGCGATATFPTPHLVEISVLATVTDLGAIVIGPVPPPPVSGLAYEGGTLYASLGAGVGDLISMPPGVPAAAVFDHAVTAATGGGSLAGLTHDCGEGFNVPSDIDWLDMDPNWVIADDFRSDGRPITCVRWWGSYVDHRYQPIGGGGAAPGLPGACCFDGAPCIDVPTETICFSLGGKVFLPGESCVDDPCGREIDGWLVSFHTDLPVDQNPLGFSQPLDLLGLYFCPEPAVRIIETNIVGWDGHCVFEYIVELQDCHLLHSLIDPRPGATPPDPAREVAFCETENFIYWLDVQAVVGHTYVHGLCGCNCDFDGDGLCSAADIAAFAACFGSPTPPGCDQADFDCDGDVDADDQAIFNCLLAGGTPTQCCPNLGDPLWLETPTQNHAEDHYWGWHTSPDHFNDVSVMGMVVMGPGGEWLYPSWEVVDGSEHFEGCDCLGDFDGDLVLTGDDIQGFVDCVTGNVPPGTNCTCADMNMNGGGDFGDVTLFVDKLIQKAPCMNFLPIVDQAFELLTPSQLGACCLSPTECIITSEIDCVECRGGIYIGDKEECPTTTVRVVVHTATQWSHSIETVVACPDPARGVAGCTNQPFEIDPWTTEPGGTSCEDFSHPDACPIPADFFGPGSDPFGGQVCFEGVPLGITPFGDFGDADTLVLRTASPFDRCDVSVPFPTPPVDVSIEVVALHLSSVNPITVTFNGGQNPEAWDVEVTLSDIPNPSSGILSAVKEHCNGGTYDSALSVAPKFTFTRVSDQLQLVLDAGLAGCGFIDMSTSGDAWVHDPHPNSGVMNPVCTDFHPGVEDQNQVDQSACDCDLNGIRDVCDLDSDGDGVIDACEACPFEPALIFPNEPGQEVTCDDGIDNDCDGAVDCADADCAGVPPCP